MTTKKVSLTLEESLVADLVHVAARLGISRSALCSMILAQSLPSARQVVDLIPASPTPQDVVRYRGESEAIVEERMESLRRVNSDLFAGE
jgi:hypothetical protein